MNVRARDLMVVMRGALGMLPGANAIGLHLVSARAYLLIRASTNAAVHTLGHDLDLGAPELNRTPASWSLCAHSEDHELSVDLIGPQRLWRRRVHS